MTVPLLRHTLLFVVVVATIGGLQLFAEPLLFDTSPASANGGAGREFQTVALYLYQTGVPAASTSATRPPSRGCCSCS